jgi:hypothetical protein
MWPQDFQTAVAKDIERDSTTRFFSLKKPLLVASDMPRKDF